MIESEIEFVLIKLTVQGGWKLSATAHEIGINTTSTIMFGHQENISDWATHLLKLRNLQSQTGGNYRIYTACPL